MNSAAARDITASPLVDGVFTPEHEMFRDLVRKFIQAEIEPHYRAWEKTEIGHPVELWRKAGAAGLLGLCIPEAYGGPGCDSLYPIVLADEMGKVVSGCSLGATTFSADLITEILVHFGSDEQKRSLCPGILSGDVRLCAGITEPEAGSDVNALRSRARLDADNYVLNGQKTYISHGMHATHCFYVARTDGDVEKGRGHMTMFLVPVDTPGFERRRLETMGEKAGSVAELFLADVRVPRTAILGEEGAALTKNLSFLFAADRVMLAFRSLAIAELAFNLTVDYVKQRKVFGRRVMDFQNTQFKLAEIKADLLAGDAFRKSLVRTFVDGALDAATASAAKLWFTEMLFRTANECLQLHGGLGYMSDTPINRIFTFARLQTIYAGTSEIQKGMVARYL